MSQQGERPAAEDEWWSRLYDENAADTGPAWTTGDTLDDRFDSASDTVAPRPWWESPLSPPQPEAETPPPRGRHAAKPQAPPQAPPPEANAHAKANPQAEPAEPAPPPPPPPTHHAPPAQPTAPVAPPAPPTPAAAPTPPGSPAPPASPAPPTPASPAPPVPAAPPAPPRHEAPVPTQAPPADEPAPPAPPTPASPAPARPQIAFVGGGPPTYDSEPTALPAAQPQDLGELVADTVLDGARYGTYTLRAASIRGDSPRYRGEPRRDALLTARFGSGDAALVLVAVASGARAADAAHLAAADACRWIAGAVGRSHARLAEDIRAGRRGDLKSGLHRLTDRSFGKLRARAAELGVAPEEYTAGLRCLLLSADPGCRTRVFFGVGPGGLFRLRDGVWQDIEPQVSAAAGAPVVGYGSPPSETPDGDRLTMDLGIPTPPAPYIEAPPPPPAEPFRFRASVARPGDALLLCSNGLAEPLRSEPELADELAARWAPPQEPPGLAAYLADAQLRVKGYADDRTAVAVWEA
ncbi:protein phosphatase 2C domain-containing protein [Streptomyces sp. NPDC051907]|uniref:protein phosphatase 2C domain-containing protein n=1 Tax=Streptomyces sp. NPDC051907 TaxID=3155284 RepID=UPI00341F318C